MAVWLMSAHDRINNVWWKFLFPSVGAGPFGGITRLSRQRWHGFMCSARHPVGQIEMDKKFCAFFRLELWLAGLRTLIAYEQCVQLIELVLALLLDLGDQI